MEDKFSKVDELIELMPYEQNETLFMEALQEELIHHYDDNEMYRNFCNRKGFDPHLPINSLEEIPPVSVSVFKNLGFKLGSVPKEDLTMALQSSATSGVPSTILMDKVTAKRQGKVMVKVIGDFICKERKPFLIMDIDPRSADRRLLGARFAAVTGYLKFASKTGYFLKADDKGVSYFDVDGMQTYIDQLPEDKPVVVFGFTYIMYQNVLKSIKDKGIKFKLPEGSKIIHIGGWKKLESEKVEKSVFNNQLSECFGIKPTDVIDVYGFTEQMGLNYPDCECGWKHAPAYSRVLVRDTVTREILPAGKEGLLEFITPVPHSYPGNCVLTDDIGIIDDSECNHGRSGTKFKIVGRLKKAEVRGCGDILSEKLKFNINGGTAINSDTDLKIEYFRGQVCGEGAKEKFASVISSLKSQLPWIRRQPIDALIGLIGEASKKWLSDDKYAFLKDKGLLFLSNWCSMGHLNSIGKEGLRGNIVYSDTFLPCADSSKHLMKANSRGLVCHWLAGNVQVLGFFALVQAIITKNVNLLKISSKDGGVFSSMLSVFENLTYTTADGYTIEGNDLLKTIGVVYFSRNASALGNMMSQEADVRIAWGGKEAVETVATYPSKIGCETVIFGPKLSFAVIAKEELSTEQDAKKLARRLSVDVSVFDQGGCASPHNLYIEKGGNISAERFCEILADVFPKTEIQIPKPMISPEQISQIHSARGVYDFKGNVWGSQNMSWTILYDEDNELSAPVYSRVLFVHAVDNMDDSLANIKDYIQTIGLAAPIDRAVEYASKATEAGVARCPVIGRMLNFEMPWDGIVLIDRLVKWNTLGGPLY
jgi:hypothetical protein